MNDILDQEIYAKLLLASDIVILDTETTGLEDPEVCEITVIDSQGNVLLDSLVKPSKPVSVQAELIHGITSEMLSTAPTWSEIHEDFIKATVGKTVLIYNAEFDEKAIDNTIKAAGLDSYLFRSECVMEMFAAYNGEENEYWGGYKWKNLIFAANSFGINPDGAHRAKSDCLMTLGVLKGMAGELDTPEPEKKVKSRNRNKP